MRSVPAAAFALVLTVARAPGAPPTATAPGATAGPATTAPTTTRSADDEQARRRAERLERGKRYLIQLNLDRMKTVDWVTRAFATVAIGQIDHPDAITPLMMILHEDGHRMVRLTAWAQLIARFDELSEPQRAALWRATMALEKQRLVNGQLRATLISLMAMQPVEDRYRSVWKQVFIDTHVSNQTDHPTIYELGRCLAVWQDRELVDYLLGRITDLDDCFRATSVLMVALADPPDFGDLARPPAGMRARRWSTEEFCPRFAQRWKDWHRTHAQTYAFRAVEVDRPYSCIEKGPPLLDPSDPHYRQKFEEFIGTIRMKRLDVCFIIDSTGSMGWVLHAVQTNADRILGLLGLIGREPRLGVTLFRDYGDEYVVRVIPLSASINEIRGKLLEMNAHGGGDMPEAVYEGIRSAVERNQWRKSNARRILLLLGDAPPHPRSVPDLEKLLDSFKGLGLDLHTIYTPTQYERRFSKTDVRQTIAMFERIAGLAGGEYISLRRRTRPPVNLPRAPHIARPSWKLTREMRQRVNALPAGFRSRLMAVYRSGQLTATDLQLLMLKKKVTESWLDRWLDTIAARPAWGHSLRTTRAFSVGTSDHLVREILVLALGPEFRHEIIACTTIFLEALKPPTVERNLPWHRGGPGRPPPDPQKR